MPRRASRGESGVEGLFVIDKPAGITSHDVVDRVRRALGERRVGHAGTLDPDATGVLVVAVGSSTRLLRFVSDTTKTYTGEIVFGVATSSFDSSGEVTATYDMSELTIEQIRHEALGLTGSILQIPPMVSARKVDGKRLYAIAREGGEVEREARPIEILSFKVEPTDDPLVVGFEVECTSGTYVRTLASDLGERLGGGAHLRELRRTAVGPFSIDHAVGLDEVSIERLRPSRDLVVGLATVICDDKAVELVAHGARIEADGARADETGPFALLDGGGRLLGVYQRDGTGHLKAFVVLSSPDARETKGRVRP